MANYFAVLDIDDEGSAPKPVAKPVPKVEKPAKAPRAATAKEDAQTSRDIRNRDPSGIRDRDGSTKRGGRGGRGAGARARGGRGGNAPREGKRVFDRKSSTSEFKGEKREGHGAYSWGRAGEGEEGAERPAGSRGRGGRGRGRGGRGGGRRDEKPATEGEVITPTAEGEAPEAPTATEEAVESAVAEPAVPKEPEDTSIDFDGAKALLAARIVKAEVQVRAVQIDESQWKSVAAIQKKELINEYTAALNVDKKTERTAKSEPKASKKVLNIFEFAPPGSSRGRGGRGRREGPRTGGSGEFNATDERSFPKLGA